jgi:uncharacterized protein (TIGR02996 family)
MDFVSAILEDPDDNGLRLVYADWLEHGAPSDERQPERAEFIRVQCEIELVRRQLDEYAKADLNEKCVRDAQRKIDALRARERGLLDGAHDFWAADLPALRIGRAPGLISWEFRRGFVEDITCPAAAWLDHAAAVLSAAPMRRVTLTGTSRPCEVRVFRHQDDFWRVFLHAEYLQTFWDWPTRAALVAGHAEWLRGALRRAGLWPPWSVEPFDPAEDPSADFAAFVERVQRQPPVSLGPFSEVDPWDS